MDLRMSECMRPAAEKTRSTPADEAGQARYCFAIFASLGPLALDAGPVLRASGWLPLNQVLEVEAEVQCRVYKVVNKS